MTSLSDKITNLRKIKKIGQGDLADMIGISRQGFINALKNNSFKVELLEKIAEKLEVNVSYFFSDNKNAKKGNLDGENLQKRELEMLQSENLTLKKLVKLLEEKIEG